MLITALALSLAPIVQIEQPVSAERARATELVHCVVEHRGDNALRDRLVPVMEVWFDAGEFLVGAARPALLSALERRDVRVRALPEVLPDDELFVVDLGRGGLGAALGAGARVVHEGGGQALVALAPETAPRPAGFETGHSCHGGHVAVLRRAWRPAAAPLVRGVPVDVAAEALGSADARISALVSQVDESNIESDVVLLASNFSRLSTTPAYIDTARDQILGRLQSMGWSPTTQFFSSQHGDNVVLEIPGSSTPGEWVVLGAHYDSINLNGSNQPAPGADDNASGSAALLEIARILAGAGPFERSIRLVWFAGEEYGLLGAEANAAGSKNAGETIVGMLNTDMNAYRAPGDTRDVDFATNSTSAALTAFCDAVGALYVPSWSSKQGVLSAGSSDHAAYTAEGFPAVFYFEDLTQFYSSIHTSADSYPQSTTDFLLSRMVAQGVLAVAAELAQPLDLSIAHTPLADTTDATGPYPVDAVVTSLIGTNVSSATLFHSTDGQSYTAVSMSQSGSTWSAVIPSQGSPLTISYYLEAVDDQGYSEVLPEGADLGAVPYSFFVGTKTPVYVQGFEGPGDAGWTHAEVAGQDDWQRGAPQGKAGDPASAFEGSSVWGNDLGPSGWNGAYSDNVENWLRSPVVDASQAGNVTLSMQRWLTVESGQYDQAQIRVNGTVVWENPSQVDLIDGGWTPFALDISPQAAGNPFVQVEFRLKSDGGVTFGGWNLDAFELVELGPGSGGCPPPTTYCTSKATSILGCLPAISFAGTPSASAGSGFDVLAGPVPGGNPGLFLYTTNGAATTPVQNAFGFLCITTGSGLFRIANQPSGGNNGVCNGQYSVDFNLHVATQGQDAALVAGAQVDLQAWYRDPPNVGTANLTEAGRFTLCP